MQLELKGFQEGMWLSPFTMQVTGLGTGEEMSSRGHTDLKERGLEQRDDLSLKALSSKHCFQILSFQYIITETSVGYKLLSLTCKCDPGTPVGEMPCSGSLSCSGGRTMTQIS